MQIKVRKLPEKKEIKLKLREKSTIENALKKLNTNLETVVVRKNGKIVPECESLKNGDEIEVFTIISGG